MQAIEAGLSQALLANPAFKGQPMVLEKTENSDLLEISKASSQEFFERTFAAHGPLWTLYADVHAGYRPKESQYVNFVAGRMFFCKNVEARFMRKPGPEKTFELLKGEILEKTHWTPANLMMTLAQPFETLGQIVDNSLLGLYANEQLRSFEKFHVESKRFEESNRKTANALHTAELAFLGALQSMHYSFVSSLAMAYKLPLTESRSWKECELDRLNAYQKVSNWTEAVKEYGFHSDSPYDLSVPRYAELEHPGHGWAQPAPQDKYARWRENAKMCASRYLSVLRTAYMQVGRETGLETDIFHLRATELQKAQEDPKKWAVLARAQKEEFESYALLNPARAYFYNQGVWQPVGAVDEQIKGRPAGAPKEVEGTAVWIDSDADFDKDVRGKIICSSTFSPRLSELFKGVAGCVSETGGILAHSAIIAREYGLPCVIQVRNLSKIKEGTRIRLDGKSGLIRQL